MSMTNLTHRQVEALEIAQKGHNLVICGQAGTGKSFVLRHVIDALKSSGRQVHVTATTGIASQQFSKPGATTLHNWAGIRDARHTKKELLRLLECDEHFQDAADRIRTTDTLIIDEMSMLSKKVFELLEGISRTLRECPKPFGGIQMILAGDFYQLPPVKNVMYSECGDFCFTSTEWPKIFPHQIELTDVLRQDEPLLVQAINESARGCLSTESCQLLTSLSRPVIPPQGAMLVKLYATNQQVDVENTNCVVKIPGGIVTYHAEDVGDVTKLRKVLAPKVLHLKRHCPVMLLKNISKKLSNGMIGTVVGFDDTDNDEERGPIVDFQDAGQTLKIQKEDFSVHNPELKVDLAKRRQYPLKPAFAVTIHKSQGMTLPYVQVECHQINRPGQLGVAVGRAKSTSGLRVLNFNKRCCVPQLAAVNEYYNSVRNGGVGKLEESKACCSTDMNSDSSHQGALPAEIEPDEVFKEVSDITDEELASLDVELAKEIVEEEVYHLPDGYNVNGLIKNSVFTPAASEETDYHRKVNAILWNLETSERFRSFLAWEKMEMREIYYRHMTPGEKTPQKDESAAMSDVVKHTHSKEHRQKCQQLFQDLQPSDHQFAAVNRLMTELRKRQSVEMSNTMPSQGRETITMVSRLKNTDELTDGGRGKIRYVGGYCIAKVRYQYQQQVNRLVFSLEEAKRMRMNVAHQKVVLLSGLTLNEAQAQSFATDKGSLNETSRRQNLSQGLTHITDPLNQFFIRLTSDVIKLQSPKNIAVHGEHLGEFVLNSIQKESSGLTATFTALFDENDSYLIDDIFKNVTALFCRVMVKQLRKDYLSAIKKKKGIAHRHKVLIGSGKGKGAAKKSTTALSAGGNAPSMKALTEDSSAGKVVSHVMLQTAASDGCLPKFKRDLQKLCMAYDVKVKRQDTGIILKEKLKDAILFNEKMPKPDVLAGAPSTVSASGSRSISSARRQETGRSNMCRECQCKHQGENEEDPWIQCDGKCSRWFHRDCAEIFDDDEWDDYTVKGLNFYCVYCPPQ